MDKVRVLFIGMHRFDRSPSQRYRFEQYFPFLEVNNVYCELSYLISEKDDKILYSPGNYVGKLRIFIKSWLHRLKDVKRVNSFDYIFMQREAFMTGTTYFEKKFAKSTAKLIFDFDDSIWLEDKNEANGKLAFLKKPSKTSTIISLCDTVVAGNQYLAEYAKQFNKNVVIIPTTIDTNWYKPAKKEISDRIIIGWSGSFSTIKHFESAIGALTKIKSKYGDKVDFKVIGDSNYRHKALGIVGQRWRSETEVEDLQDIDIGIMPLPNIDWTRGKCGLKGLQYMGLAIPSIMSPVGVNIEIITHGVNGILASTEQEWIDCLTQLIESSELRKTLGGAGRKTVEDLYSMNANANKYLALFTN
ncbi:MAG: glycosyltransferase family 4 protein [Cyclobacteriaceae bacterium]|nr:glycosyltransferase family 4 protein [Cyclobacteriaceae bacterium]